MESLETIIKWIFGGSVDVSKITNIIVCIYSVVMSIVYNIANKKVKTITVQETNTERKLAVYENKINQLEAVIGKLTDIVVTAYLSNNSVPVEVKQKLGSFAEDIQKIADFDLSKATSKLIDVATTVAPQAKLEEKKDEILAATEVAEEAIDAANNVAQSAIDKIRLS